ncbi:MAG: YceI family protein [Endozoicomonas sp.]|uniref:YceI family protein n=1 Tax=Endozoicomonas sp. TaxID=1892382 RepID=UPI003D9B03B0
MNALKKILAASALSAAAMGLSVPAMAADYAIDTKGAHAFINFKISHLGYSWLHGNFEDFNGSFTFDEKDPSKSKVDVTIKTASVDSSHAERDKHLRGSDFLNVSKFPEARFVSTRIESTDGENAKIYGDFTLKGITKEIVIDAVKIGEGKDPWGGYRAGFSGTTTLAMKDFKMMDLGPASSTIYLTLEVEGIRQ